MKHQTARERQPAPDFPRAEDLLAPDPVESDADDREVTRAEYERLLSTLTDALGEFRRSQEESQRLLEEMRERERAQEHLIIRALQAERSVESKIELLRRILPQMTRESDDIRGVRLAEIRARFKGGWDQRKAALEALVASGEVQETISGPGNQYKFYRWVGRKS